MLFEITIISRNGSAAAESGRLKSYIINWLVIRTTKLTDMEYTYMPA